MDGPHSIERCEEVSEAGSARGVPGACRAGCRARDAMLLKPNMIVPGNASTHPASVQEVAVATCVAAAPCPGRRARDRVLVRWTRGPIGDGTPRCDQPPAGSAALEDKLFLRTGASGPGAGGLARPGREPVARPGGFGAAGAVHSAASLARYTDAMEDMPATADAPSHRREWHEIEPGLVNMSNVRTTNCLHKSARLYVGDPWMR